MDTFHIEISEKDLRLVEDLLNAVRVKHTVNRPLLAYCRAEAIAILDSLEETYGRWDREFHKEVDEIIERGSSARGLGREELIDAIAESLWKASDLWVEPMYRNEVAYAAIKRELDI